MIRTCKGLLLTTALLLAACGTTPDPGVVAGEPGPPVIVAAPQPAVDVFAPQPAPVPDVDSRTALEVPEQHDGLLIAHAPNHTMRPAHREFSPDLLTRLRVPDGFAIDVFAQDLEEPRGMIATADGAVYVAERKAGRVRLLRDTDGDGRADDTRVALDGLPSGASGVHDLLLHDGSMYLITETELLRARVMDDGSLGSAERLQELPAGGQHPNRTLGVSPDGTLFVSIGSTCNACVEPQDDHAALHRITGDGTDRELFAEGLRNTIGFAWHPATRQLWGFDHNSDGRGNEWPPEELNLITEGTHYGWPFCGGDREPDHQVASDPTEPRPMTKQEFCATTGAPALTNTAHSAPMQMVFYTGDSFPAEYRNDAFVTMRGSWNRNPPSGYNVMRIRFDDAGNPTASEPFVTGWLIDDGTAHFGRVMGLAQAADGSLLIGDDTNGVIYRVTRR